MNNIKGRASQKRKATRNVLLRTRQNSNTTCKILQWNAGGLSAAKLTEIKQILKEKNIDIVIINEANITIERMKYYTIPNYITHALYKSRQVASGIFLAVKNTLSSKFQIIKEMNDEDTSEIVELKIWKNNIKFIIYGIYSPPKNKNLNLDKINITTRTVLIGDLNAASPQWGYNYTNDAGKVVEDFLDTNNMNLIFNSKDIPTFLHYSGATTNPDLTIVSSQISHHTGREVIEDPGSGHRAVVLTIDSGKQQLKNTHRMSWNFQKANWTKFRENIDKRIQEIDQEDNPSKMIEQFITIVQETAKQTIPRGKQVGYKTFWNPHLQSLKTLRNTARRKAEETKKQEDIVLWRKLAAELRLNITKAKKATFNSFLQNLNYRTDSRKVYQFMNKLNNKFPSKTQQPIIVNGKEITDGKKIAEKFNTHYATQFSLSKEKKRENKLLKHKIKTHTSIQRNSKSEIFTRDFSTEELKQAIRNLKNGKQPGPDKMFPEFLKHLSVNTIKKLLTIYNKIWNSSHCLPSSWTKATIIPILKKGKNKEELSSYRPIALTSVLAKVQEKMIIARLNWYLENQNIIAAEQAGFRSNRSTSHHLAQITQEIKNAFNKQESVLAVFIDLKGAYDTIWRMKLIHKLKEMNITGNMLTWFKKFLHQRWIATKHSNYTSPYKQTKTGLPQGAISSTTLFNIYVNDLPKLLKSILGINVSMFADDIVIWTKSKNNKNQQANLQNRMNQALAKLQRWTEDNNMEININKTFYQFFSLKHKNVNFNLHIQNKPLQKSENTRYLGVQLDNKLNWNSQIQEITNKTRQKATLIKRLSGVTWGSSHDTLNNTYRTYIKPIIKYGCETMITATQTRLNKLETVQNNILRLITGAVKTTPVTALQSYTQNKPIVEEIRLQAATTFLKIKSLPDTTWAKQNPMEQQLKTQMDVIKSNIEYLKKLNLPAEVEPVVPPQNPLEYHSLNNYLDLVVKVKKEEHTQEELKRLTLCTIGERFPQSEWLHIYTDGSLMDRDESAGAGVYSTLFAHYLAVGKNKSNFDAEIEAILFSLEQLTHRPCMFKKVVLLVDSKAAIQAITSNNKITTKKVIEIRKLIKMLENLQKTIYFQWIPSHIGLHGNDIADELAKKGTRLHRENKLLSARTLATKIKTKSEAEITKTVIQKSQGKNWSEISKLWKTNSQKPRKEAVATFRLTTGHDCLATHLHKIGIYNSEQCTLCNAPGSSMDKNHLLQCNQLNKEMQQSGCLSALYWEARSKMG